VQNEIHLPLVWGVPQLVTLHHTHTLK